MLESQKLRMVKFVTMNLLNYFLSLFRQLLEIGIEFVGGCCGTTVKHIEKAAEMIKIS